MTPSSASPRRSSASSPWLTRTLSDRRRRESYLLDMRNDSREAAELEEGRRALQAELRFQEGERLLQKRDAEAALRCFEEAASLYPDEGEYHAYMGWSLFLSQPGDPERREEGARPHSQGPQAGAREGEALPVLGPPASARRAKRQRREVFRAGVAAEAGLRGGDARDPTDPHAPSEGEGPARTPASPLRHGSPTL